MYQRERDRLTLQYGVHNLPAAIPDARAKHIHQLGRIAKSQKDLRGVAEGLQEAEASAALEHRPLRRLLATRPGRAQLRVAQFQDGLEPASAGLEGINCRGSENTQIEWERERQTNR